MKLTYVFLFLFFFACAVSTVAGECQNGDGPDCDTVTETSIFGGYTYADNREQMRDSGSTSQNWDVVLGELCSLVKDGSVTKGQCNIILEREDAGTYNPSGMTQSSGNVLNSESLADLIDAINEASSNRDYDKLIEKTGQLKEKIDEFAEFMSAFRDEVAKETSDLLYDYWETLSDENKKNELLNALFSNPDDRDAMKNYLNGDMEWDEEEVMRLLLLGNLEALQSLLDSEDSTDEMKALASMLGILADAKTAAGDAGDAKVAAGDAGDAAGDAGDAWYAENAEWNAGNAAGNAGVAAEVAKRALEGLAGLGYDLTGFMSEEFQEAILNWNADDYAGSGGSTGSGGDSSNSGAFALAGSGGGSSTFEQPNFEVIKAELSSYKQPDTDSGTTMAEADSTGAVALENGKLSEMQEAEGLPSYIKGRDDSTGEWIDLRIVPFFGFEVG